ETQLERLALDGRLTATLLVPDLRVDDRLEVAFTIFGENPTLGGRRGGRVGFHPSPPLHEDPQRVVRPLQRPVFLKPFNNPPPAHVETHEATEESSWCFRGERRVLLEELSPPWTVRSPCYQITEFGNWGEIARLFEKYYRDSALPG